MVHLITISSSSPQVDALFLNNALMQVPHFGSIILEHYTEDGRLLSAVDGVPTPNDSTIATSTLFVANRQVMIVLILSSEFPSKESSSNGAFAISTRPHMVPWMVSEEAFLVLYSNLSQKENSTNAPTDFKLQLPSGSVLLLISNRSDLSNPEQRLDRMQRLLTLIRQKNASEEDEFVDIQLTNLRSTPTLDSSTPTVPPPTLPKFPSLDAKILVETSTGSELKPLPLNSQEPIDFATSLFRGKLLMILKPPNPSVDDPYWDERIFSQRKRRLIINIQGQFQRVPQGTVYAGAEISQPMKLGLVTRSVCTLLLKLVERFNTNIHSSFGTANDLPKEVPHIVAPAYTFFERLVVTSPGQTPPDLREEIVESPESLQQRRKSQSLGAWNTTDTYTFSFYTMYIDLPTWQLVGLPASGDIGLQTFWGQSLLRICMYDKTDANEKKHVPENNRYAFSIQLQYLGKNGQLQPKVAEPPLLTTSVAGDGDYESEKDDRSIQGNIFRTDRRLRQSIELAKVDSLTKNNVYPIRHSESHLFLNMPEASSYEDSLEGDDDEDDGAFFDAKQSHGSLTEEVQPTHTAPILPSFTMARKMLSTIDDFCPFWMDLCSASLSRNGGSVQYIRVYACRLDSQNSTLSLRSENVCLDFLNHKNKGNSPISIMDSMSDMIKDQFSPRLSSSEKLRRCLGLALSDTFGVKNSDHVSEFREMNDNSLQLFGTTMKPSVGPKALFSVFVMRALCDRHWVEEWACLSEHQMTFRHLERRRGSEQVVLLSNVLRASPLPQELYPSCTVHPILVVATLARTFYLMFPSEADMSVWRKFMDPLIRDVSISEDLESCTSSENQGRLPENYGAADDFVYKSSMWNCKHRRILNGSQLYFRHEHDPAGANYFHPSSIVETALKKVVQLSSEGLETTSELRIREFFECAADLKLVSVSGLDEATRLAFYLNLYHLMISHAYLVLGPPDSSLKWISYFNNIAYAIGDDIFSLTEVEHSIIRANMSYPTQFLSRFVIPKSAYPLLTLQISDYRINFALNCGSLSNPPKVILYKPDRLSEQLDAACRLYLFTIVSYRRAPSGDLQLMLPRICQWFSDDFGPSRSDLLTALEPFLAPDVQDQLNGCRLPSGQFDMNSIVVRYLAYNFECRPLVLV